MFHGSIVALLTPMTENGEVDLPTWRSLVAWHLEQGSNGLVVAGTTGESTTLSQDEFLALLTVAVEESAGRVPVIAGTGTADTAGTIERSRQACAAGAAGLLVVTPYYVRPMPSGLEAHYRAVADAVNLPLVLYNVPSRTAVDMLPETTAALARHERIVGIKEAVGRRSRIEELRRLCDPAFTILSGDDRTAVTAMEAGANGVISVAANLVPARMARLCKAMAGDDCAAGRAGQDRLRALFEQLAVESNPIPVKWAAWRMGLVGPGIRLPLSTLDENHQPAMESCLAELGLLP